MLIIITQLYLSHLWNVTSSMQILSVRKVLQYQLCDRRSGEALARLRDFWVPNHCDLSRPSID